MFMTIINFLNFHNYNINVFRIDSIILNTILFLNICVILEVKISVIKSNNIHTF